jgi:hypothetical protein
MARHRHDKHGITAPVKASGFECSPIGDLTIVFGTLGRIPLSAHSEDCHRIQAHR